jgi:O-antigen ligase/tetratricopeptide (TPR) repeat protein
MNFILKSNRASLTRQIRPVWCCSIALLAPFLGGSTERWAQGVVLLLIGGLVVFHPPRSCGFRGFFLSVVALPVLGAFSFLPAAWFGIPAWRWKLLGAGIALPPTLSPQPWISTECLVLLAAGILWIYWLARQSWNRDEREMMAGVFTGGASLLAAVALITFYCKTPVVFWHSERGFGPFPNRNQTGSFFAISGILALACTYENFRAQKIRALFFGIASSVIVTALITSYSRAAVILFFAGAGVWIASLAAVARSAKPAAFGGSVLILTAAGFLIFGGHTLERFQGAEGVSFGFRRLIYHDALALIRSSPWSGTGLGNFAGVFSMFRNASAMPSRILHPESDWLWLAAECGWAAVALVVFAIVMLAKRIFPLTRGTHRRIRLAAASAALVFALHGLVDVAGHRLGSVVPGLFVLGLALNNPVAVRPQKFAAPAFILTALATGVAECVWLCAVFQGWILPGAVGVSALKKQAQIFLTAKDFPDATAAATQAIAWAPLDWELYFSRGTAEAASGNTAQALEDFQRVNLLESTSPTVTFEEGKIWLGLQPSFAAIPWRETLRRCVPGGEPEYYAQMLGFVNGVPELRRIMHALAQGNFDLELIWLRDATTVEFGEVSTAILKNDPALRALNDLQKTAFFRLWSQRGNAEELMQLLTTNPQWQPFAWRRIAEHLATRGDAKGACETAFKYLTTPALPKLSRTEDIDGLKHRLLLNPGDYRTGYALFTGLTEQKKSDEAMGVLRGMTSRPDCPRYFYFLEAKLAFQTQQYAAAWNALKKFDPDRK